MFWKVVAAAAVACAALAATACGGESAGGAQVANLGGATTETGSATTGASSEDPQEIVLEYTACMRKEGIDLPDPDFSGGDRGGFRIRAPEGIDRDDPDFQAAQEKCQPIIASLRQQFDPEDRQAFQDAALEFAKCMRNEGIDFPDPDFSGGAPGRRTEGGPFGAAGVDREDPKVQAAQEACQGAFEGLRRGDPPATGSSAQ